MGKPAAVAFGGCINKLRMWYVGNGLWCKNFCKYTQEVYMYSNVAAG